MPESDLVFVRCLASLLADRDPAVTVEALGRDWDWLVALTPACEDDEPDQPALPPIAALALFSGMVALVRSGQGERAWPWFEAGLDAYAATHPRGHRFYRWHSPLDDALEAYPNLRVAVTEALIAGGRWSDAAHALNDLSHQTAPYGGKDAFAVPALAEALAAADAGDWLGPTGFDEAWAFARGSAIVAAGSLDERHAHVWNLYADHLLVTLRRGETGAALALVAAKAEAARRICDDGHETGNYHLNALCVLAHAGRVEAAAAAARELVRRGYWDLWRLNRDSAAATAWATESGQLGWLAALDAVPAYRTLHARHLVPEAAPVGRAPPGPFRALHAGVLGGRTRKRCAVSNCLIAPGDPVYRFRLYHHHVGDAPLVAAQAAFDASPHASWRARHETDAYALTDFARVQRRTSAHKFEHPDIARLLFDLVEGAAFDVDAFIDLVADPFVLPMRFCWLTARDQRRPEPPDGPFVNDARAGEFVNLTALVLRCGHGPAMFARLAARPAAVADPVFALLATFAREDCRTAAARHFDIPDLPDLVTRAFAARPGLDDLLALAACGRDQPRFAAALAAALARYNLHLYSNYHPQADWYLQDLEHYACAKGCQLLFFFAHVPEHVPVLATMLAHRWMVDGERSGGFDAYDNSGDVFWRTAVTNRMLHAPEEVQAWFDDPVFAHVRGATKRETARQVAAHRKQGRPVRSRGARA
jgi:hypothetical protein